jgi:hypothetical protein
MLRVWYVCMELMAHSHRHRHMLEYCMCARLLPSRPQVPACQEHIASRYASSQVTIAHIFQLLGHLTRRPVKFFCDLLLSSRVEANEGLAQITINYILDRVVIGPETELIATTYAGMIVPVPFPFGSVCACMHVCMCVCIYVCMYVCIYVCMYACMHVCVFSLSSLQPRSTSQLQT